MNPIATYEMSIRFKLPEPDSSSLEAHLRRLQELLDAVGLSDPLLAASQWLIATGVLETSELWPVYDGDGPTAAALSVITQDNKNNRAVKSFCLWNGQLTKAAAASIECHFDRIDRVASSLQLSVDSASGTNRFVSWERLVDIFASAASIFDPRYVAICPDTYEPVFDDRPGVGWMLYLPRALTVQHVPEARALVPVMGQDAKGKKVQTGTIIVSVTDAPFSDENPEHVKIANAIEIRLVDQDLLPRYADL